jgi:hypothetical protein
MRIKKLSALVILTISLAGLAGCSTSEVPQTVTETQQTINLTIDHYPVSSYQVSLTAPTSWTFDPEALTLSKGESSFFFDPDYSTDEILNPNVEDSTVTTNSGEILYMWVTTNKDDPSQKAEALIGEGTTKDPSFGFAFEAPVDELDSEFFEILKSINWEVTVYKK